MKEKGIKRDAEIVCAKGRRARNRGVGCLLPFPFALSSALMLPFSGWFKLREEEGEEMVVVKGMVTKRKTGRFRDARDEDDGDSRRRGRRRRGPAQRGLSFEQIVSKTVFNADRFSHGRHLTHSPQHSLVSSPLSFSFSFSFSLTWPPSSSASHLPRLSSITHNSLSLSLCVYVPSPSMMHGL